jgi:hypothetical protein
MVVNLGCRRSQEEQGQSKAMGFARNGPAVLTPDTN